MKRIDLHNHTTASDGTFTPEEAVRYAATKGLAAIAITDHDTAEGTRQADILSGRYGVEVIPGIEISTEYHGYGIHILGYFINPDADALVEMLAWVIEERKKRNREIMSLMRADGIHVTPESLADQYPGTVIGRPHLAAVLVEAGLVGSVQEGFDRYLSEGMRYYRARTYLPLQQAFNVISSAGGKAVFAHPLQYGFSDSELRALAGTLKEAGCVGMECLYSGYSAQQSEYLMNMAADFDYCVTGGSDFHGSRKPHIDMGSGTGDLCVPYELLEKLRAR